MTTFHTLWQWNFIIIMRLRTICTWTWEGGYTVGGREVDRTQQFVFFSDLTDKKCIRLTANFKIFCIWMKFWPNKVPNRDQRVYSTKHTGTTWRVSVISFTWKVQFVYFHVIYTQRSTKGRSSSANERLPPSPQFFHPRISISFKLFAKNFKKNAHQFFQRGRKKTKIVTGLNEITQIFSP